MADRAVPRDRARDRAADRERTRDEERGRRREPVRGRAEEPGPEEAEELAPEEEEAQASAGGRADGLSAAAAAEAGLRQIAALTGKSPEGVTGVEPTEDGWLVSVEILDDRRVPSSGDILALYEAELDPDGSLLAYRRARRYSRNQATDEREAPR
ncbi:MAG TPA: gas vesicle protein GvpO [Streptosporangiaceae bacterium]